MNIICFLPTFPQFGKNFLRAKSRSLTHFFMSDWDGGGLLAINILVLRIVQCCYFFGRDLYLTEGNKDRFGKKKHPELARDVFLTKSVKITRG